MKKIKNLFSAFGMLGVIAYFTHTILGEILWKEYNPITTDISSLTAVGAPNRDLLLVFTYIYGIFMLIFLINLVIKSFKIYHFAVKTGYIIMLIMQIVSLFGYALFPLEGDKTVMTFQNAMHIIVTITVVLTTVSSGYFLGIGYIKKENKKRLGIFILIMAIIITLSGMINPISMSLNLNILGLTERITIYSLQIMMFVISVYYTFNKLENK
jgi:hypothetical protein